MTCSSFLHSQHERCRVYVSLSPACARRRQLAPRQAGARRCNDLAVHRTAAPGAACCISARSQSTPSLWSWPTQIHAWAKQGRAGRTGCMQSGAGMTESGRMDTPLHIAAERGDLEVAKSLLAQGADVNAREVNLKDDGLRRWGWTPLHCALLHDHIDMVKLLLAHGAAVEAVDNLGVTPLAIAVCRDHKPMVELLLSKGAHPTCVVFNAVPKSDQGHEDVGQEAFWEREHPLLMPIGLMMERMFGPFPGDYSKSWSPLHHAVAQGCLETVSLLLAHGADPDTNGMCESPKGLAIAIGNLDMVKLLWSNKHTDENDFWYHERAILKNQADIVKHLLSIGLDAKGVQNEWELAWALRDQDGFGDGQNFMQFGLSDDDLFKFYRGMKLQAPAIMQAATAGRLRVLQALLEHGADVHATTPDPPPPALYAGWTALHLAARTRSPGVVELLCEHGSDPKAKDSKGRTPLHLAAFANDAETVKVLLQHGANAETADNQGRTAMHSAASQNGSKLRDHEYEALCQKCRQTMPSDMIERWDGRFQYQELHPVNLHYQHTVDTLKAQCANVSAQDDEGLAPFHCAAWDSNVEMLKTLICCGVSVNAKAHSGWTGLHFAVNNRDKASAKILIAAGASVNVQDNKGCTPLHLCADKPHKRHSSDSRDRGNWTPCSAADLAAVLISHGADPTIRNQQDDTPADVAIRHDDPELVGTFNKSGIELC